MGSVFALLVVLAIVAGLGLVVYAAFSSLGKPTDKPWEGYQKKPAAAQQPDTQQPGASSESPAADPARDQG